MQVTLYETMRSVIYLPFYLAATRGTWASEGLEVDLVLSPSAAQAPLAVMDGRAGAYFGGPMRVLMNHDADQQCPLICFGQVVARDPFMLVGQTPMPDFRLEQLVNFRVAIASIAPTPWLTLQEDLRQLGIDPARLRRAPDASMQEHLALLASREVDVVQAVEPFVKHAQSQGNGHIWHRFAARGDIGFSSFVTTRQFASDQRSVCVGLARGIAAAQSLLFASPPEVTAQAVSTFLPDIQQEQLSKIITAYCDSGVWAKTPDFSVEAFRRLKAAMLSGGQISADVPYKKVVCNSISEEALDLLP